MPCPDALCEPLDLFTRGVRPLSDAERDALLEAGLLAPYARAPGETLGAPFVLTSAGLDRYFAQDHVHASGQLPLFGD